MTERDKTPRNPRLEEDLVFGPARIYGSWEEWFNATISANLTFGLPYDQLKPPAYMVEIYGPMPTPPWAQFL